MVRAYHVTYAMDTVVTRGSNTYGPFQYPEKLIPFFTTEALDDRPLPLYGDGKQIRDWLHVDDHARGVDAVLHYGEAGEAYNLAGENQRQNIEVTERILELLQKPKSLIKHVPDREGHDRRYAMTADKRVDWAGPANTILMRVWKPQCVGMRTMSGGGARSNRRVSGLLSTAICQSPRRR